MGTKRKRRMVVEAGKEKKGIPMVEVSVHRQ
jgi:hypothetical protein